MSRTLRSVAASCALTLVLVACGGDDADTTETPVETTVPESTDAPETTEPVETTAPTTEAPVETVAPTSEAPVETTAPETTEPAPSLGSIIDIATEAGEFTTLLAAAEAAGLTEELATRDITLLAPTDEAFAALGQEAIDALLADPVALTDVLQGHVLAVPQTGESIAFFNNVLAINGASWDVVEDGETLRIGGAAVVMADIEADNGIIHVIDAVLVPAPAAVG